MAEITFLADHRENQLPLLMDLFPHPSYDQFHSYYEKDPTLNLELGLGLCFCSESTDLCDLDDNVVESPSGFLPSDCADRFFADHSESSTIPFVKLEARSDEDIESAMGVDMGFRFEELIEAVERERDVGFELENRLFFVADVDNDVDVPVFMEEEMGIEPMGIEQLGIEQLGIEQMGIDQIEQMGNWENIENFRYSGPVVFDEEFETLTELDQIEQMGNWENIENFRYSDPVVFDEEFETLTEHLARYEDIGGGSRNPPPASRSAVDNLMAVVVTETDVDGGDATCAICKDDMVVGEKAKSLPCSHRYHWCCIDPWLRMRNTCPVCRYEFPTDDSEYERRRIERGF